MCRGERTRFGCTKTQFTVCETGYSMFYSKICNYVHPYALIAEVVGKRERGNDLVFQKYQR